MIHIVITGHRPQKLGGFDPKDPLNVKVCEALEAKMVNAVKKFDNVVFRIGMAVGVDQWAAWICVKHGFAFDAYLPFSTQDRVWPKHVKDEYRKLLTYARNVYTVTSGPYYEGWMMAARNRSMVDGFDGVQADYILAVWDGSPSGTANCVNYAKGQGLKAVRINPKEL